MIVKALIVLVAFPVFAHAVFTASSMLLGLMLPAVLAMTGSWSEILSKSMIVGTLLFAVNVSFRLCRRLWPTPAVSR